MTRLSALVPLLLLGCRHGGAPVVSAAPSPPSPDLPACARTVNVAGDAALTAALDAAVAGDCLVLADGEYRLSIGGKQGRADAPIVVRAAHRLGARVSAAGVKVRESAHVILEGIDYSAGESVRFVDCDHCRLTRSRLHPPEVDGLEWVVVDGRSDGVRIDHNDLGPFAVKGNLIQLLGERGQVVQHTRIDHNLFHDRAYKSGNGWETIRAGLSGYGLSSAHTVIEENLFRGCAGDPEIVSVKSSDNVIRHNTFRGSAGQLVLRHGNRDVVEGNWLIGQGLPHTGGIRVLGQDHKIFDNYVGDVAGPALILQGAVSDAQENGRLQYQVHRAEVVNNTFVASGGVVIGDTRPFAPADCVFANNIVEGGRGPLLADGGVNTRIAGNLFLPREGVAVGDFKPAGENRIAAAGLDRQGELWRRKAGASEDGLALAAFAYVTEDIAGRPRQKVDVGAEAWSTLPARRGPLTEADVGPDAP